MDKKKGISRKDFLKGTACIALCPIILSSLSSCGNERDGTEGDEHSFNASEYDSMAIGETKAIEVQGLDKGALLHKKGDKDFVAFNASCPHMSYKIRADGVCTSGHGGTLNLETGTGDNGPIKGLQIKQYPVTYSAGKITIKV